MHIVLSSDEVSMCRFNARAACLGGRSSVRTSDRQRFLKVDQFVGQLGNAALSKYLTGNVEAYCRSREHANNDPWKGDGGHDLRGLPIDIKTSLMRLSRNPSDYRLVVRIPEVHDETTYILGLVENPVWRGSNIRDMSEAYVTLVGWASTHMLGDPETTGIFAGACVLKAVLLNPMMPIRWQGRTR